LRETQGFPYLGKVFDSDPRSVQRISVAVAAAQAALGAGAPFSIDWTCADNSTITMDGQQMAALPVAFAIWGDALHQQAKALRAQIEAATTVEDVQAVAWPT
jgi:hypothetical protein